MIPLVLHEDRYFDPDPTRRRIARELYAEVKELPIVGPHGHVDPAILADNSAFPEPATLIVVPDHYIFRMLYSQGIRLEELGVPPIDGSPVETDARKIWQRFADHYYLFAGTPTGAWLTHEFYEVFGIREKLTSESAMRVYDHIAQLLEQPEYLPRALFDRFNIEVLTTTDAAGDTLVHHKAIQESDWGGRVIPCFRPDAVFRINRPNWKQQMQALERVCGYEIPTYATFIQALEERRAFFKEMGAVSTDHAVLIPYTERLSEHSVTSIFESALKGTSSKEEEHLFEAHMLMEMARMSIEDGMVMQIHPGSFRDHNAELANRFGPDKGADIPVHTEFTHNLHALLNTYGHDPRLSLVLFTLDETTYSRELAPLAGHYPALKLGPAWWFFDSIEGMTRYRQLVTETAGIYNTAGFNDDTRAFPSIPARHDLSRRVDANFLADQVARHIIDLADARIMIHELAYGLVKKTYKLE
ncbi:MAG: glucuronate isomerase [Rhodothermaceae bacterium]|nr:glucuronate isomerase [Rhodothermaceae bacterium]